MARMFNPASLTDTQQFTSIWDSLENTPQQAASMKARSALMMVLAEVIRERGMTQGAAAALFGVTQPRVSDLVRGKINLFSLDTLIGMAATAGIALVIKVSKLKLSLSYAGLQGTLEPF